MNKNETTLVWIIVVLMAATLVLSALFITSYIKAADYQNKYDLCQRQIVPIKYIGD